MSLTQSDKTTLTKYPPLPSKCVICLRDSNGELDFIDFQMSVDIYGAVVICAECFYPVAELLGFVHEKDLEAINEQVAHLIEINRELNENNGKLNATLDSLVSLRPDLVSSNLSTDEGSGEDDGDDDFQLELPVE